MKVGEIRASLQSDFTPVEVIAEGNDLNEVFNNANRAFDLFRTFLNLSLLFGRVSHHFILRGFPKPLAKILPPPVYGIFRGDGKYESYYSLTTRYPSYEANTLVVEQINQAKDLAERLQPTKSTDETIYLLIEALEKYGQALDTSEWKLSFLLLWQILELITLQSTEEFTMKNVINRVNGLLRQHQVSKDLLAALYETRNRLVHAGTFPEDAGLEEVNFLKWITENVINALFARMEDLSTKARLSKFYELVSTNDADLKDRRSIIEYIQSDRSAS